MDTTRSSEIDFRIQLMVDADFKKMSAVSCHVETLDHFFRHEVKNCVSHKYLAAYCARSFTGEIIAAFTLMNDSLMIISENEKSDFINDLFFETKTETVDFLKKQTAYPAINIGHLGTAILYQGQGIGTAIIDLVAETYANYRQAGCQFITVDALNNPRTIRFYQSNGFSFQTNKDFYSPTRRMYRIL